MKTAFLVLASTLLSVTMANHVPGHMSPRKHAKLPKVVEDEDRRLQGTAGENFGLGGVGGLGDVGGVGGLGDVGGVGGLGGLGGVGGYRALRSDDVDADEDDDEVVVAGGTVVRGGAVVARPVPRRRWY